MSMAFSASPGPFQACSWCLSLAEFYLGGFAYRSLRVIPLISDLSSPQRLSSMQTKLKPKLQTRVSYEVNSLLPTLVA